MFGLALKKNKIKTAALIDVNYSQIMPCVITSVKSNSALGYILAFALEFCLPFYHLKFYKVYYHLGGNEVFAYIWLIFV